MHREVIGIPCKKFLDSVPAEDADKGVQESAREHGEECRSELASLFDASGSFNVLMIPLRGDTWTYGAGHVSGAAGTQLLSSRRGRISLLDTVSKAWDRSRANLPPSQAAVLCCSPTASPLASGRNIPRGRSCDGLSGFPGFGIRHKSALVRPSSRCC